MYLMTLQCCFATGMFLCACIIQFQCVTSVNPVMFVTSSLKNGMISHYSGLTLACSWLNIHKSHISCGSYIPVIPYIWVKTDSALYTLNSTVVCVCVWVWFCALCRWLVAKDSFVLYMRPKDNQVGMVILYDKGFHIKMSAQDTGVHHGVATENLHRKAFVLIIFTFCCDGIATHLCWLYYYTDYLCGVSYISEYTPQMSHPYCLGTTHAVSIRLYWQRCAGLNRTIQERWNLFKNYSMHGCCFAFWLGATTEVFLAVPLMGPFN